MTEAAMLARGSRSRASSFVTNPITLWVAFVVVHFWLGFLGLFAPGQPLGDVTLVYRFWVEHGLSSHQWVGLDIPGVYPVVALLPMIAAHAFGSELYASTWLSLVMLVDAAAFLVIMGFGRDRRLAHVAWWWLGLLLLLGPVAVGRIDSITAPVAIVGLLCLGVAPRLAGVLLAVAAWIKVWPAALIAAVLITFRERVRFLIGVAAACLVIVVIAVALGGGGNLLSFVTQQTGRGLQIESGIATFWMWAAYVNPNVTHLSYDTSILTFQLHGPGVELAASLATPLMALVVAGLLGLGLVGTRRGISVSAILPPLALAITVALIIFNKVGSPQFVTWLAVPIVFGLATAATASGRGRSQSFRSLAILALVIAVLTQAIYPFLYHELLDLNPTILVVLSVRNILYLVLFGWAVASIVRLVRAGANAPLDVEFDHLPQVWPVGRAARTGGRAGAELLGRD